MGRVGRCPSFGFKNRVYANWPPMGLMMEPGALSNMEKKWADRSLLQPWPNSD